MEAAAESVEGGKAFGGIAAIMPFLKDAQGVSVSKETDFRDIGDSQVKQAIKDFNANMARLGKPGQQIKDSDKGALVRMADAVFDNSKEGSKSREYLEMILKSSHGSRKDDAAMKNYLGVIAGWNNPGAARVRLVSERVGLIQNLINSGKLTAEQTKELAPKLDRLKEIEKLFKSSKTTGKGNAAEQAMFKESEVIVATEGRRQAKQMSEKASSLGMTGGALAAGAAPVGAYGVHKGLKNKRWNMYRGLTNPTWGMGGGKSIGNLGEGKRIVGNLLEEGLTTSERVGGMSDDAYRQVGQRSSGMLGWNNASNRTQNLANLEQVLGPKLEEEGIEKKPEKKAEKKAEKKSSKPRSTGAGETDGILKGRSSFHVVIEPDEVVESKPAKKPAKTEKTQTRTKAERKRLAQQEADRRNRMTGDAPGERTVHTKKGMKTIAPSGGPLSTAEKAVNFAESSTRSKLAKAGNLGVRTMTGLDDLGTKGGFQRGAYMDDVIKAGSKESKVKNVGDIVRNVLVTKNSEALKEVGNSARKTILQQGPQADPVFGEKYQKQGRKPNQFRKALFGGEGYAGGVQNVEWGRQNYMPADEATTAARRARQQYGMVGDAPGGNARAMMEMTPGGVTDAVKKAGGGDAAKRAAVPWRAGYKVCRHHREDRQSGQ